MAETPQDGSPYTSALFLLPVPHVRQGFDLVVKAPYPCWRRRNCWRSHHQAGPPRGAAGNTGDGFCPCRPADIVGRPFALAALPK
jgi:hypothetical protein